MSQLQMFKRACRVFPRTDYTEPSAVRHARRQWAEAVQYLRNAPGGSKWILDKQVTRQ
jgi:hypothetical protein